MNYVGLLWQDLVRSGGLAPGRRLPPVFPVVIYNGLPRWGALQVLQPLLAAPAGSALAGYQPQFRYFLFDEGRVPLEQAGRAGNAVASLLALEASRDLDALRNEIARLRRRLSAPEHDSLRRAFTVWIHRVAPGVEAGRVGGWAGGRAGIGLKEGLEQGRLKGERTVVARQLVRRFGPLPEVVLATLAAADADSLAVWRSERLLDASSLDEVFQAAP